MAACDWPADAEGSARSLESIWLGFRRMDEACVWVARPLFFCCCFLEGTWA